MVFTGNILQYQKYLRKYKFWRTDPHIVHVGTFAESHGSKNDHFQVFFETISVDTLLVRINELNVFISYIYYGVHQKQFCTGYIT